MRSLSILKYWIILLFLIDHSAYSQDKRVENTGDILQIALPLTALSSSIFLNEKNNELMHYSKSFAASIILTHTVKTIIDKERPNGAQDGYSFPSGHTSCAFAGATLLTKQFGWKIGIPAYALASYVGWSRINAQRHDLWDVMAGAVIGTGSIHLLTKLDNEHLKFQLSRVNNHTLVGFVYVF